MIKIEGKLNEGGCKYKTTYGQADNSDVQGIKIVFDTMPEDRDAVIAMLESALSWMKASY